MTTSNYMPSIEVHVAFNAGFGTDPAAYVWTDVSDWVEFDENIGAAVGRADERATAEANQLTLTLDNSDGRFTAGLATSPYYPNVRLYRPIRVQATPAGGGTPRVRFRGFVAEWPTTWDGHADNALARITASSRIARLGLRHELRSIVEEEILSDLPVAYYPLGEPEGSTTAADVTGSPAETLIQGGSPYQPVEFGVNTGPGTDGITAPRFNGGKWLRTQTVPIPAARGLEVWARTPAPPFIKRVVLQATGPLTGGATPYARHSIRVSIIPTTGGTPGAVQVDYGSTTLAGTVVVADDLLHHIVTTVDEVAGTLELYIDGVLDVSTAVTEPTWTVDTLAVGGSVDPVDTLNREWFPFVGTLAHAAFHSTHLTAARVTAHQVAATTGFDGDTVTTRLARYAQYGSVPAADVGGSGTVEVAHVDPTGRSVVDLMRLLESSEGGVLYDRPTGELWLHDRATRYTATTTLTLDIDAQEVESDFSPTLDPSTLVNDATASNVAGTIQARIVDHDSRNEYGGSTESLETASTNPRDPMQAAAWLVNTHNEPGVRVPSLTVDVLAQAGRAAGHDLDTVLTVDVGDIVTVQNLPTQLGGGDVDYFVEGWVETIGPESWSITFNVSPAAPYMSVLVLDDATRGLLDGANVWAY